MKKATLLAILTVMGLLAQSAFATITFTAQQPSQNVSPGSGTFTVSFSLDVTQSSNPAYVQGYDMVFEALASQNGGISNGQFNVTGASAPGSGTTSGWIRIASGSDALTAVGSDHSGFVQTAQDEGFAGDNSVAQTVNTPISGLQLATYTFSYSGLSAGQTYNFQTTLQSTSANKFSDVTNNVSPFAYAADSRALFSITVPGAIPEPATWSLFGLGALGTFALNLLRARRKLN
jgi:PEP-CTERM motif